MEDEYFWHRRLETEQELRDCYHLRWQVYCVERGFLSSDAYPDRLEIDPYDGQSLHFGAFYKSNDALIGTVRLVLSRDRAFPLFEHCTVDEAQAAALAAGTGGEISRLAVSKDFRRRRADGPYGLSEAMTEPDPEASHEKRAPNGRPRIVMGLYKALYQETLRRNVDCWFAAMESSLARLLDRSHFTFQSVGPQVDYYGPVMPYVARIRDLEQAVYDFNPDLLREFTDGIEPELLPSQLKGVEN